ncbi:MAG: MBL fold metallo-hydrolase [Sebaldella sp.]|nr:MBL fold metallo-hydrolase [Sebaldella sp.]
MKFSVLGSSSSGNSSFIEMGNKRFLIDAGFSGKKTIEKLEVINKNINDINGILVTHEHGDHIQGLGVLSRKHDIPIYIAEKSYNSIKEKIGKIEEKNINFIENSLCFEECLVKSFDVMHDAERCLGFSFEYNQKKLTYASDIGFADKVVKENFKNSDVIVLESNYDYDMLMNGPYHWNLKNRVKSKNGHLSNVEAAKLIIEVASSRLKKVYLLHISNDNNTPELAHNIVKEFLDREKINVELEVVTEKTTLIYEVL